jgi:HlyD family secretion protein
MKRLSSPERLDKLMQVISPKDWRPLSALAIFGANGIWSVFGSIPITVTGVWECNADNEFHPRDLLQVLE